MHDVLSRQYVFVIISLALKCKLDKMIFVRGLSTLESTVYGTVDQC